MCRRENAAAVAAAANDVDDDKSSVDRKVVVVVVTDFLVHLHQHLFLTIYLRGGVASICFKLNDDNAMPTAARTAAERLSVRSKEPPDTSDACVQHKENAFITNLFVYFLNHFYFVKIKNNYKGFKM